ncbi:MAG TPA: flagellar hook assembly protein FlgD [Gallionellaceae bacterium]|nr:flagellar hook assembly protein FlgD [Gallionellaceae bacterium]
MINPVTSGSTTSTSSTSNAVQESQDRFLKLLVTQMKNQDPLNPMDNAQVTSQMAQLSTVSGIDKLNATLQALSSSMIASQSMQAASMIGHVVMVPGNRVDLVNSKGMGAVDLAQPADSVTVSVSDAAGNVVRKLQLGSQNAGPTPFQWDGRNDAGQQLPDGAYQFSAESQLGGVKSTATTMSYGLVNSVMQGSNGAKLDVGQLGEFDMSSVKQIL